MNVQIHNLPNLTALTYGNYRSELLDKLKISGDEGTELITVTDTVIEGSVLERKVRAITVFDSNGEPQKITYDTFERGHFKLDLESKRLITWGFSRSSRFILNKMFNWFSGKLTIQKQEIKIDKFIGLVEESIGQVVKLNIITKRTPYKGVGNIRVEVVTPLKEGLNHYDSKLVAQKATLTVELAIKEIEIQVTDSALFKVPDESYIDTLSEVISLLSGAE